MGFGFDLDKGATALSNAVKKVMTDTGLAKNLSNTGAAIEKMKDAVSSGLGINASNITAATAGFGGAAPVLTAIQQAKSNVNNLGNLFDNIAASVFKIPLGFSGTIPNPLHSFTTYNYQFQLSVLDDLMVNFPDETYRRGMVGQILLQSASGNPSNRVQTAFGSFDFYMEDLTINGIIGFEETTGNTNAATIKFKVIEPYSMGIFFQAIQVAALNAGHANYLEMPLLLKIEFKGHVDAERQNITVPFTTKYIPLKLSLIQMRVTAQGCEYDIKAIPWNEKAYSSVYSELKTDVSIIGKTVGEMLQTGKQSLQAVLNQKLQEAVKRGDVKVPDQILISFPKDIKTSVPAGMGNEDSNNSATVNPSAAPPSTDLFKKLGLTNSAINQTMVQNDGDLNDIGASTMGFNLYKKAQTPFAKDNLAYDEKTGTYKRGNITIDPSIGEFKFAQGSTVQNSINQVILMSEYGRTSLSQISPDGMIQWWRIETQFFNIPTDENLDKTGIKPKLVVYRVVPYKVSASIFNPPNTPAPGIQELEKKVIKEYNYIYTGKNVDVLDFDIDFKAGFYTSLTNDGGANNGDKKVAEKTSGAKESNKSETPAKTSATGNKPVPGALPTSVIKDGVVTKSSYKGGGGLDDNATLAAKQFHDAITAGVDMVNLELKILGDPYFLGDSGMGNYTAAATDNHNINADGAMDYQSGEVHVTVNFRTPIDANLNTGLLDFPTTSKVPLFSGLYRVFLVENTFSKGLFLQKLKMMRLPNQEIAGSNPPKTLASLAVGASSEGDAGEAEAAAAIKNTKTPSTSLPGQASTTPRSTYDEVGVTQPSSSASSDTWIVG